MTALRSWFLAGSLSALLPCAMAVPFAGTLTANDPVYNRTLIGSPPTGLSGVGTAVSYDVFPFYVTAAGTYVAETLSANFTPGPGSASADDTFITIYQGSFSAASPLVNAKIADDDSGVGFLSLASTALITGTQYFLVVTSFGNQQYGGYTGRIDNATGAMTVVLGAVPEASTTAMLLAGLVAGGLYTRRQRRAA